MGVQKTYNEIIAFAIDKEQEAVELYSDLAERAQSPSGKILFKELADMERGHKTKLKKLDMGYFSSQDLKEPEDPRQDEPDPTGWDSKEHDLPAPTRQAVFLLDRSSLNRFFCAGFERWNQSLRTRARLA